MKVHMSRGLDSSLNSRPGHTAEYELQWLESWQDFAAVGGSVAETVIKGGIMLLETSQGKVLQAKAVAVGSGSKGKDGGIQQVSMKDNLPKYGDTKEVLDNMNYF